MPAPFMAILAGVGAGLAVMASGAHGGLLLAVAVIVAARLVLRPTTRRQL